MAAHAAAISAGFGSYFGFCPSRIGAALQERSGSKAKEIAALLP
jgi:hypothetical protein